MTYYFSPFENSSVWDWKLKSILIPALQFRLLPWVVFLWSFWKFSSYFKTSSQSYFPAHKHNKRLNNTHVIISTLKLSQTRLHISPNTPILQLISHTVNRYKTQNGVRYPKSQIGLKPDPNRNGPSLDCNFEKFVGTQTMLITLYICILFDLWSFHIPFDVRHTVI